MKLGAKYDVNVTDKFTLTPELNTSVSLDRINFKKNYERIYHNLTGATADKAAVDE